MKAEEIMEIMDDFGIESEEPWWKDVVTGFHLTALRNVEPIMEQGLIPYELVKTEGGFPDKGIWLWACEPEGELDEIGCVIQRAIDHETLDVALLEVTWQRILEWGAPFSQYDVNHVGTLWGNKHNAWRYHEERHSRIVVEPIPPDQIKLVRTYDLRKILEP